MRSIQLVIAALLCLTGLTRDAEAAVTITLEWGACGGPGPPGSCTATGSSSIGADAGQTLRLDIYMIHDETSGLFAHAFSLNFDTDLGNELSLGPMAPAEWAGTDVNPGPVTWRYQPFNPGVTTVESTGSIAGRIDPFESNVDNFIGVLPRNGAAYSVGTWTATAPARYRVGQAFFIVTSNVSGDGADIFSGAFTGFDGFVDGPGNPIPSNTILFGTASVNPAIPEPGTLSLLGLGLVGFVLAARSSRA